MTYKERNRFDVCERDFVFNNPERQCSWIRNKNVTFVMKRGAFVLSIARRCAQLISVICKLCRNLSSKNGIKEIRGQYR